MDILDVRGKKESASGNPLISIIVPVYNVEKYLQKCVYTIINQTYKNIEIILVDDGSTDSSSSICDKLKSVDSRIIVVHKKNGGLSDARNVGIKIAKGEYYSFVDSDDYVALDMIEYLYSLCVKFNTLMSICSHYIVFRNGLKIICLGDGKETCLSAHDAIESMLYHRQVDTSAWAKLYHKSLFELVKYPKGMLYEDIGTTYKLFIEIKKIGCGFFPKYYYVIRKASITTSSFSEKKFDQIKLTDEMAENVTHVYPDLSEAVLRRQIYARISTLNQMLDVKNPAYRRRRDQIYREIISRKNNLVKNSLVPKRDIIAIRLLSFSLKLYSIVWKLYCKYYK